MAPELEHKIIGVRPGEKLHEVMITEDDARTTVELSDRYIIEPSYTLWSRDRVSALEKYKNNGVAKVDEGFRYASNTNKEWLNQNNLMDLIKNTN